MSDRMHNLANLDINNTDEARAQAMVALWVGAWRRLIAIYGDHLPGCAERLRGDPCSCGFADVMADSNPLRRSSGAGDIGDIS